MTAGKRTALAFCSLLVGFAHFALAGIVPTTFRYGLRDLIPSLEIMPLYFALALPGFILALPFVWFFKNAEGSKAWIMLVVGSCIGPAFLTTWTLLATHGHFSWQGDGVALILSVRINVPTTICYVVLLKYLAR